ncbi:MAG TPA: helix-hairpin-helix domain-containing protein, partial [Agriterribacter sp.]|nr:helix-hairpin-helix domain-containing protein [Agriterribacter sp.]
MKRCSIILCLLLSLYVQSQEEQPVETEQQLEAITESAEDAETTDDRWWQQLEYLKKNRLNLNTATAAELTELQLLSALQVSRFLQYRRLLGALISIYELQSVPGWDIPLIQKLLPYITIASPALTKDRLLKRFTGGSHTIGLRYSSAIEKAKGYLHKDSSGSAYAGDPSRLMFRYTYRY